jgi:hypothetical protein
VVKLYVSTYRGAAAHGPYTPGDWSATSLTWVIPPDGPPGNGFGAVQVVNTDEACVTSNVATALLEGDPASCIPTILYLNGVGLGPPDPGIGLVHIDTVVARGDTATIIGTGQVVNRPSYCVSNAVAAVLGARPAITAVTLSGSTVTVEGAGFCIDSVINLYNLQGSAVVNLGGFGPDGGPRIPLDVFEEFGAVESALAPHLARARRRSHA